MSESALPLGNILNSLMEHPEMLQKAMNLASTLASSGVLDNLMNAPSENSQAAPAAEKHSPPSHSTPDLSSIGSLFTGLMNDSTKDERQEAPNDRPKDQPHRESREQTDHPAHHDHPQVGHTERIRLLQSLRPFLPCDKQEKIDFVIKLLGLLEAAERMGLGKLF